MIEVWSGVSAFDDVVNVYTRNCKTYSVAIVLEAVRWKTEDGKRRWVMKRWLWKKAEDKTNK